MMRNLLLILCIGWLQQASGQSAGQYIAKGDKEQAEGYFQTAITYYRLALRQDTNLLEANYQTAEAYRKLRNYKRALEFYDATIDIDGQDEYPQAHFYKGLMLKQLGKYRPAMQSFQQFLSMYRARDDLYRWARDEEVGCYWAIEHERDTAKYEIIRPDSGLNTIHAEMSPYLVDANTMYFSTMRYESDEVKKSKPVFVSMQKVVHKEDKWLPVEWDLPIDQEGAHFGNGAFALQGKYFYYSRCEALSSCQLWRTENLDGTWQKPVLLPDPVNVPNSSNTQPAVAELGETAYLIFSSNRDGGKGGMDLWFVELKQGEPTSRIRNLGNIINSKGDEITPFYDPTDSTLYYSSNRQAGYGGFDVFKSVGIPGSNAAAENMGPGVNSPADDYYLFMQSGDSLGYFASNRQSGTKKSGNETCCNDFYKFKLIPPPIVEVLDTLIADSLTADTLIAAEVVEIENPQNLEELQTLLPISLYFHNDRPDPRTTSRTTSTSFDETIEEYLNMRFDYIDAINASSFDGNTKLELGDLVGKFFEREITGSLDKLNKALRVLLAELEKGNTISLAVKGYASPLADSDYNLNLTFRRIASMENYIMEFAEGAFKPYLESEHLVIDKIPYGESQSAGDASDDVNDQLGAIYSLDAARERRIEILRIDKQE